MHVFDTIEIQCNSKTKSIRLCTGDLSQVPKEWNTDFLLISAFPNDYSPTPSSVVGALNNRGISVRKLSKEKEEDLRAHFYCWYSKPVSEVIAEVKDCPFKRLMCFENPITPGRSATPVAEVGTMFRGLTTVSNMGSDLRVVSSLLKTGDSGHDKKIMLKAMVNSCAHWMVAGLPIETFSIVLFSKGAVEDAKKTYSVLIQHFGELKSEINELVKKQTEAEGEGESFDFYLSYSGQDNKYAKQFSKVMKAQATSMRFFDERETLSEESSWQSKMYSNVKASKKVVHFLSPPYLKAAECVEQFNISYCLNNSIGSLLAPLFLDEGTDLPNYMKSIQWFNCHKYDMNKMSQAVKQIYNSLIAEARIPRDKMTTESKTEGAAYVPDYDVFISYAHKNKNIMNSIREKLDPSLQVFLDSEELRHGFQWQQAIYESLERSTVIFAVLSDEYFESAVCREEFHLAIAAVLAADKVKYLIPLRSTDKLQMPSEYNRIPTFSLGKTENDISKLCQTACDLIQKPDKIPIEKSLFQGCLSQRKEQKLGKNLELSRTKFVNSWIKANKSVKAFTESKGQIVPKYKSIAVLASPASDDIAKAVKLLTAKMCKNGSTEITVNCQQEFQEHELSRIIDSSDVILVILDDKFFNDSQCLSFLNLGLLDCRLSPNKKRITVVRKDSKPEVSKIYPLLIDNKFNMADPQWEKLDLGKSFGLTKGQINCLAAAILFTLSEKEQQVPLADGRIPVLKNPLQ